MEKRCSVAIVRISVVSPGPVGSEQRSNLGSRYSKIERVLILEFPHFTVRPVARIMHGSFTVQLLIWSAVRVDRIWPLVGAVHHALSSLMGCHW